MRKAKTYMLRAGVATVDISPKKGIELAGYPHYPRNNTGVHDPLYAAALYLNNGAEEIVLVTLDILFFSKQHVKTVRDRVAAEFGITGKNIMISCSHTHSGPWAAGRLDIESLENGAKQPEEYVNELVDKIVAIIGQAKEVTFKAEFCSGAAICGAESGVGGNRRIPGGPHDPLVSVLAVRDTNKTIRGIFVNYTLHPTFIHEWSTVCTADYPCYLRLELLEKEKNAVVGFSQGASGNQSSRYFRQGENYEEAERVGRTLGRAAYSVFEHAKWVEDLSICTVSKELDVELRTFGSEKEIESRAARERKIYKELYARYGDSENREEYYKWQNANLKLLGTEDQLGYVRLQNRGVKIELLTDENPAEIQIICLGDTCIVGVPGEVFVEYALYIKAMAGYRTVVFNELSNGVLPGYLYTPEALVEGGYETDTSMLGENFGRHLVDCVLDAVADARKIK